MQSAWYVGVNQANKLQNNEDFIILAHGLKIFPKVFLKKQNYFS